MTFKTPRRSRSPALANKALAARFPRGSAKSSHSFADLIGTDFPGGSYREVQGPGQTLDRDDSVCPR
jgi:hypothetical protein